MSTLLRKFLNRVCVPIMGEAQVSLLRERLHQREIIREWHRRGRPVPPPHAFKQKVVEQHAKQFGLSVLIETGTYQGDMVEAMRRTFTDVYSVELGEDLHAAAQRRFRDAKNVHLLCGDSGKILAELVPKIDRPALFWLDGHYSGGITARGSKDTPVLDELTHILDQRALSHIILIDDARCFGTEEGYPTVDAITAFVRARRVNAEVTVGDDIIRVVPPAV